MVISRLTGGLGNQLFQYAAAKALADSSGRELLLDVSYVSDNPARAFALEPLGVREQTWRHRILPRHARRMNPIDSLSTSIAARARIVRERKFEFDGPIALKGRRTYLIGYWQSPKYFASVERDLKERVAGIELGPALAELESSITAGESVAVHVRRGDYVSDANAAARHGACGLDYYERAIAEIRRLVAEPRFFVFSDDIDWCRENLPLADAHFVTEPEHAYEDLILMSRASHNVIANSSFSWWGAWLGEAGRTVVAPERWFAGLDHSTVDLIPAAWTRL